MLEAPLLAQESVEWGAAAEQKLLLRGGHRSLSKLCSLHDGFEGAVTGGEMAPAEAQSVNP